jgi:hypothetical protein
MIAKSPSQIAAASNAILAQVGLGGGSAAPCPLPDNNPGVSFARIKRP